MAGGQHALHVMFGGNTHSSINHFKLVFCASFFYINILEIYKKASNIIIFGVVLVKL